MWWAVHYIYEYDKFSTELSILFIWRMWVEEEDEEVVVKVVWEEGNTKNGKGEEYDILLGWKTIKTEPEIAT